MKRMVVVLGVAAVMAAIVGLAAGTALARAETVTIPERIPGSGEVENPCTGELITVEGTLHLVRHATFDGDQGVHNVYHFNLHARGVSPSGAKYVVVVGDHIRGHLQADTGMYIQTNNVPTRFLRQGEDGDGDDFMARSVFHITLQPDGEFTAVVENFDSECK